MIDQNVIDELTKVINERSKALTEGNSEFFEQLLIDEFMYTNASGKCFDKAGYIDYFIKSRIFHWDEQIVDEINIRRYGDVILLTCRVFDKAIYNDEIFEGYFRSMQIFSKFSNNWRYIAGQTTTIT
jgi:hypothetical protein